jgi:hypothetical protein
MEANISRSIESTGRALHLPEDDRDAKVIRTFGSTSSDITRTIAAR